MQAEAILNGIDALDAVDAVGLALRSGTALAGPELAEVTTRLERVRLLGGRFALVDVSPEVAGMLKAVGRGKLVC